MKKDLALLNAIEARIRDSPNPYASVGELATEVIRLINDGGEKDALTKYFNELIDSHALDAAPEQHVKYARRLISAKVTMFEDVFKVFALLAELEAMKILGLTPPQTQEAQLKSEFLQWLSSSPENLRKVADLFSDPWSQDSWFFQALR